MEDANKYEIVYHCPLSVTGPLHGIPVAARHQSLGPVERKRLIARRNNTTYCYDFPLVSSLCVVISAI